MRADGLIQSDRMLYLFISSHLPHANRFPPLPSQGHASLENASLFDRIT
jgi:hypothetical protein